MTPTTLNLVYFSPTGGTRRTVKNIAGGAELPVREIDLTLPAARQKKMHFRRDDFVVIALPVYGGRLPRISGEFFEGLSADQSPTAFVVVYGNRHFDDALAELKNVAEAKGFLGIAGGAFLAEHTFSAKVAANRPDAADAEIEANFGRRFAEKFRTGNVSPVVVPGNFPTEKPVLNLQIAPTATDACDACQTCVENCPTGAIDAKTPRQTDISKCIACCACVKICPRGARQMTNEKIAATRNRLETLFTARRDAELFF